MKAETEKGKKNGKRRSGLLRFLLVLVFAAAVAAIIGLRLVDRLFSGPSPPSPLDFSGVLQNMPPSPEKPVSPNTARVFFTTDGRHLHAEILELPRELSSYERTRRLLDRLIRGPASKYFEPVLPPNLGIHGIYIVDDEATIDFSEDLPKGVQGGIIPEMLAVYSIVNTIVLNVEGVSRVQILIDGKIESTLKGEIDISVPLGANLNLVKW